MTSPRAPNEFFDFIISSKGDFTPFRSRKRSWGSERGERETLRAAFLSEAEPPEHYPYNIPIEIWERHIFQYLVSGDDATQLCSITQTCRLFRDVYSPLVTGIKVSCPHCIDGADECAACATDVLPSILRRFKNVRTLQLSVCTISPPSAIALSAMAEIDLVDMRGSWKKVYDEDVERLAAALGTSVSALLLPEAPDSSPYGNKLSDASLIAISRHCPCIECLGLNGCTECSGNGLDSLSIGLPRLECLAMKRYGRHAGRRTFAMAGEINYSASVASGVARISERCSRLKHVCVGHIEENAVGEAGFTALCTRFEGFASFEATLALDPTQPWCLDNSVFRFQPDGDIDDDVEEPGPPIPSHNWRSCYDCDMSCMIERVQVMMM